MLSEVIITLLAIISNVEVLIHTRKKKASFAAIVPVCFSILHSQGCNTNLYIPATVCSGFVLT